MISDRSRQDPELDDFLKRVEDIDEAKRSNAERGGNSRPSRAAASRSVKMTDEQYKERDLREARRLLQRDSPDDFDEEMVVDQSAYNDDENDLTYKSAYNYEKTFSPKKPSYNINDLDLDREVDAKVSRTGNNPSKEEGGASFTVSKDDYLLLQRLKKDISNRHHDSASPDRSGKVPERRQPSPERPIEKKKPTNEPKKQTMPSRGKPRDQTVNVQYDIEIDMDAPMLPPRHSEKKIEKQDDPYEERLNRIQNRSSSPQPPKLPTRPVGETKDTTPEVIDLRDEEDKEAAPALPSRANVRTEPPKVERSRKPVESVTPKERTPKLPPSRGKSVIELQSVKPEPITLIDLEDESDDVSSLEEKVSRTSHTIPSRASKPVMDEPAEVVPPRSNKAPLPPVSRTSKEPMSFISSLNNNKLSVAHSQLPETPKKKQAGHSLDYLESVQLKSPSSKLPSKSTPTKPKVSNMPRSDSFINSALNSDLKLEKKRSPEAASQTTDNSTKVPPPVRQKPSNLSKSTPPPTGQKPLSLQKAFSNLNGEKEQKKDASNTPPPVKVKPAGLSKKENDNKSEAPPISKKPESIAKDKKPLPPSKPRNLSADSNINTKASEQDSEDPTEGLRSFKLRSTPAKTTSKTPPKVPAKGSSLSFATLKPVAPTPMNSSTSPRRGNNDMIEMPKLRSVNGNSDTKEGSVNGKHTPPVVPKRKPTISEALVNAKSLKKTDQSSNKPPSANDSDIPEALAKRNALNKSKVAPVVPARKISMPEALKRANQLKSAAKNDPEPEIEEPASDDINSKLEAVISLHQRKTFGGSASASAPQPLRRVRTTQPSTGAASPQLTHITKGRAKGPRRKLPSKI